MPGPDRLQTLLDQNTLTGVQYVYVHEDQQTVDVFFHHPPLDLDTPLNTGLEPDQIRIVDPTGETVRSPIPVETLSWETVEGRDVLRLNTAHPGDFTTYRLHIADERIDPYFNDIRFSFKAHCPSDLDCEPPPHTCPPEDEVDVEVDYRARDFWSFRRALLDFASERVPDWEDRLEADAGIMLIEVMSALGDELAYVQDQIGREAHLETARQRRSLRQHARLVDYNIHDGRGAAVWLEVTVNEGESGTIPAGTDVWMPSEKGEPVYFEIGRDLSEILSGEGYSVDAGRNRLTPHLWDEDDRCLPVGTTELALLGHHESVLPLDGIIEGRPPGRWVLLRTDPSDPSLPRRRHMVRLIAVEDDRDEVLDQDITRIRWEPEQALPFEIDRTLLTLSGNMIPAVAGRTHSSRFVIGELSEHLNLTETEREAIPSVIEREGADDSVAFRFPLPDSDRAGLVRDGDDLRRTLPEIQLVELEYNEGTWEKSTEWNWRRSFVGVDSSQPYDPDFVLEDGLWGRVVAFPRKGEEIVHKDYRGGEGFTIRFGDGEFGQTPAEGTVFECHYRLGNGRRGNLSADAITRFPEDLTFVKSIVNPLPGSGGEDPEPAEQIRMLAPEAFRHETYRAVRPEDYAEAARRLSWVDNAGGRSRWTGSWLTTFVTPDPRGTSVLEELRRAELQIHLDRFRQAGREVRVFDPVYADIDLKIRVCVAPDSFRGEVKESVLDSLLGTVDRDGYFSPDRFTFGSPLNRYDLEAYIQSVPGVRAVEEMRIRRRGWFDWRPFEESELTVGANEIIRVLNDPVHPDRGSVRLEMEGGA